MLASAERRVQLAKDLGVPCLAASFPLVRVDVFQRLIVAQRTGRLTALMLDHARDVEVLMRRFGLDDLQRPAYRTLSEIGEAMGGITRERVRQLEERGLGLLGIVKE